VEQTEPCNRGAHVEQTEPCNRGAHVEQTEPCNHNVQETSMQADVNSTCQGDAATQSNGANVQQGDAITRALSKFEGLMLQRARNKVERSRVAAQVLHTPAATVYACCVRAGAALGNEDPEKQVERTVICPKEAAAMAQRMRKLLFSRQDGGEEDALGQPTPAN
jgi:hypothetical protein